MRGTMRVAAVTAAGLAVLVAAGCGVGGGPVVSGPTVVVLNQSPKPALHFIDIASGKDTARVPLRSPAIDMDAGSGLVVTAQCGGVGNDADDVVGVYDTKKGGRVRYFKSVAPNPGDVTLLSSAKAVVSNGWMDAKGMVIALVDVRQGRTLLEGRVPDMTDPPATVGGMMWAHSIQVDGSRRQLRRIDVATLESVVVTEGPHAPAFVVGDRSDPARMFTIKMWDRDASPRRVELHRFDGSAASLEGSGRVYDFEDGPGKSAMIGDVLAIADFTDIDPQNYGKRVLLLRPGVSDEARAVRIPGGPVAVCAWRGEFLVLESRTGRIVAIDPESGKTRRIGAVKGADRMLVDMEVLD